MRTILIVEDDEPFREMLRTVLEVRGFNVLTAAPAKLRNFSPCQWVSISGVQLIEPSHDSPMRSASAGRVETWRVTPSCVTGGNGAPGLPMMMTGRFSSASNLASAFSSSRRSRVAL